MILGTYGLFTRFALRASIVQVFAAPWLTRIGAASYALYLLHQQIGVTLIAWLAAVLGLTGPASAIVVPGVTVALIAVSLVVYRRYEVPAQRVLVRWGKPWFRPATR